MQPLSPDSRETLTAKFHALLDECDAVADHALFGQTFDDLETFFLIQGRTFLREVLQEKLQERIEQNEANDAPPCGDCKKKTTIKDIKSKTINTIHGAVALKRRYHHCPSCKQYSFPVEVALGLPKKYSTGLSRRVARCCALGSYHLAKDNLAELCQIHLSPTVIGRIADETSVKVGMRLENNPDVRRTFQQAKGEIEFYADGTFVHILNDDGSREWREFKLGAYAKRLPGAPALPSEWHTRDLPNPTVVVAFAAIVNKEEFQKLCHDVRRSLGAGGVTSTLGDGAKWIWNVSNAVCGKTEECLDIYHGAEHISDCGKALFGEGEEKREWYERMRLVLLEEGFSGMERALQLLSGLSEKRQASVDSLLEYLRNNIDRLNYRERLSMGRAIGSGLIEGACKNLVGKRLKQTGACWRLTRANRIASLCATIYSHQWKIAWKNTH